MPSKKYDWNKIKADFMASEFLEVAPFLKQELGNKKAMSWVCTKNTAWWRAEKENMMKVAKERAMESTMKSLEKLYKPSSKELGEMHKAIINLMKAGIQIEVDACFDKKTGKVKDAPNVKALKTLWEMVKAEKEEPTNITAQSQITDDDQKLLDEVLDDNLDDV